jgi:hypothetical protein
MSISSPQFTSGVVKATVSVVSSSTAYSTTSNSSFIIQFTPTKEDESTYITSKALGSKYQIPAAQEIYDQTKNLNSTLTSF